MINMKDLMKAAEQGNQQAQNDIGLAYLFGNGLEPNLKEAVKWFAKAIEEPGEPTAFANLGRCYLEGIGVERNLELALSLLAKAVGFDILDVKDYIADTLNIDELSDLASRNNAQAQYFLGLFHIEGKNTEKDISKAIELIEKAALYNDKPEPLALFWLGYLHGEGLGRTLDMQQAEYLVGKAVEADCYIASLYAKDLRHKIAKTTPFILAKIVTECLDDNKPNDKYVTDLLDGKLFMKTLDQFGSANLLNSNFKKTLGDKYRGDYLEGLNSSSGSTRFAGAEFESFGELDVLKMREKLYCLTSIEYDATSRKIYEIDPKLKDFGSYAVIIADTDEFLRRVSSAFNKLCEKHNERFWLGYQRIIYDVDLHKEQGYSEFCKQWDYSWQKEFRVVIDMANGKFYPFFIKRGKEREDYIEETIKRENYKDDEAYVRAKQWLLGYPEPTDYAILTLPGKIELDINPDSIKDFFYLEIGDIRDICITIPTNELIACNDISSLLGDKFKPSNSMPSNIPKRQPKPTFFIAVSYF